MGCFTSKASRTDDSDEDLRNDRIKETIWKADQPLLESKLRSMRQEFWDTQPHYGGDKVIWDALKAAAESSKSMKNVIIDSAGIIVDSDDLTVCYDERGWKYELPMYVLSEPTNLIREKRSNDAKKVQLSQQS